MQAIAATALRMQKSHQGCGCPQVSAPRHSAQSGDRALADPAVGVHGAGDQRLHHLVVAPWHDACQRIDRCPAHQPAFLVALQALEQRLNGRPRRAVVVGNPAQKGGSSSASIRIQLWCLQFADELVHHRRIAGDGDARHGRDQRLTHLLVVVAQNEQELRQNSGVASVRNLCQRLDGTASHGAAARTQLFQHRADDILVPGAAHGGQSVQGRLHHLLAVIAQSGDKHLDDALISFVGHAPCCRRCRLPHKPGLVPQRPNQPRHNLGVASVRHLRQRL
mmetsp:Transcript_11335/g.31898  ORF Transcript_11335/g.31898 Transcript_11335/m.31898 type:complete len:278 (-) Transcript_11335:834-1667(-)